MLLAGRLTTAQWIEAITTAHDVVRHTTPFRSGCLLKMILLISVKAHAIYSASFGQCSHPPELCLSVQGLRTTATVMYGHIETPEDLATHLHVVRDVQVARDNTTARLQAP